jgi:hypothetical protein
MMNIWSPMGVGPLNPEQQSTLKPLARQEKTVLSAQQIHLTGVRMVLYNTNAPSEAERMETVTLSNDHQTGEISWAVCTALAGDFICR